MRQRLWSKYNKCYSKEQLTQIVKIEIDYPQNMLGLKGGSIFFFLAKTLHAIISVKASNTDDIGITLFHRE